MKKDPCPHAQAVSSANEAYLRALDVLHQNGVAFLVGGAFAMRHYCGIVRDTKDLDLFVRARDVPGVLSVLEVAGFGTEIPFPHWLAKARVGEHFIDIIHNSGNGLTPVDDAWFSHATRGEVLGREANICPPEETFWSKAFVMERERYDGADIVHLLASQADRLDWGRLLARFDEHWQILLVHLLLFQFVYPNEPKKVPGWVMEELLGREKAESESNDGERARPICRGTLLSREQYLVDVCRGYHDARLPPTGAMTEAAIAIWTDAIKKA